MDTRNANIVRPTVMWMEIRDSLDRLEGIGAEYYLGAKKHRSGVMFKKLPPTNRDLHQAREAIEKLVERKWQEWQVRTTII